MQNANNHIAQRFAAQKAKVVERRHSFGLAERKAALAALEAKILSEEAAIIAALQADFGKHPDETLSLIHI